MNLHQPAHRMTVAEFFAWAERQKGRYELVRGVPRLLPYVKLNHNRIVTNIMDQLRDGLDRTKFERATGDFAVRTGPDSIRYADVMVFPAGKSGGTQSVDDAIVIFKVLSKSTMHEDFGAKRLEYQGLAELQCYVVVAQDEPQIWLWRRDEEGAWPEDPEQICEGTIMLDAIGPSLDLTDIYRGVQP